MKKPKHGRQRPDQSNQTNVLLAVDRQNSVLAELKNDDLNNIRYSAYGQRSAERDPAASVAFNGEFREPDTGWYLLGNGYRAYNPVLRRFHSPDSMSPFGSGGLNAYSYCVGDPINYADPTGHFAFSMIFRAIASRPLQSIAVMGLIAGTTAGVAAVFMPEGVERNIVIAAGAAIAAPGGLWMGIRAGKTFSQKYHESVFQRTVLGNHALLRAAITIRLRSSYPQAAISPQSRNSMSLSPSSTPSHTPLPGRAPRSSASSDSSSSGKFHLGTPPRLSTSDSASSWSYRANPLDNRRNLFAKRSSIRQ